MALRCQALSLDFFLARGQGGGSGAEGLGFRV